VATDNHYSEEDAALLCRLFDEGHTSRVIGEALGRTPNSIVAKANRLGRRFKRLKKGERRNLYVYLDPDIERLYASCAAELDYKKSRLAAIVLSTVARRGLFGIVLNLGGVHTGAQTFDVPDPRD
jgi:hypothetical protein